MKRSYRFIIDFEGGYGAKKTTLAAFQRSVVPGRGGDFLYAFWNEGRLTCQHCHLDGDEDNSAFGFVLHFRCHC